MDIRILATGSSGNCYRISDGHTALLLDAGIPFKRIQQGLRFKTGDIDGCLVTHRHGDHSKAIPELSRRGIPVYGPEDLQELFPTVTVADTKCMLHIQTLDITAFFVHHDVPCYGYQIKSTVTAEKLLYITDTAYVDYTFTGVTHLLIEANYEQEIIMDKVRAKKVSACLAERVIQTHMSIETLLQLLKANAMKTVRQIYLLHLSDSNSDAAGFKAQVQQQTGAEVYVF